MATLYQLVRSSRDVLPVAFDRVGDMNNTPLRSVRIQDIPSLHVTQILSTQKNSGRWEGRGIEPEYNQIIRFVFQNKEDVGRKLPNTNETKVKVRCSCAAYYFYFWFYNKKYDALAGDDFPTYKRETPPPPKGRPYVNPKNLPGCCKHLLYLTRELKANKIIE